MTMTLKKVFADLRSSPGRTLLVILALAIGIWGVGGSLVSYVILTRDLNANFTQTRPPHAVLASKDFARLDLSTLRARPDIESAEFRDLSLQRIEARPDDWIPLWLFGVGDFERPDLAVTYPEKGAPVPPPGTMLIERDGRLVSNLDIGSRARVRVGPVLKQVPISGINFDPAQAPATQDHFIYAYADKPTFTEITGEPANQRLILRLRGVKTKQDVKAAVDRFLGDVKAQGIAVDSIKIPSFNEHPHQWQLNTLLLLQGGIGLLAFLMGAMLVSQLMASILAKQVREIGVLKAIGATYPQVLAIYLVMALALGVAAGVIAIPLAVWSGYEFSYFVAGKINFEILTRHLPAHVYFLLAAASLLLPIGLSWPAIRKGTSVAVHDALSDYGIVVSGPATLERPWTARLPLPLVLAARNSLRRKKRLALTVMAMALGVAIFSTGFNVRESLMMLLTDVRTSMKHDVQVVLNNQMDRERAQAAFRGIPNVERIETWNGGRGELQSQVIAATGGAGIVALPHDTDLFRPRVVAGRWLRVAEPPEVVMNQQAVELYQHPAVGSVQTLGIGDGKTLTVRLVGVVEELEKAKIYMDQSQYDAVANPEHRVNSLMFIARDRRYEQVMSLKRDIEAAIVPSELSVLYVMSQAERVKVIYDHLNIVLTTIVFLSLSVLVVGALGMASATGINILERTREIGVLRAIGATPSMIFRLFVAEGMITSVASIALGLLLAWPLSKVAAVFFGTLMLGEGAILRYAFSAEGFVITLLTTLVFGWLASRVPARRAIQVSTRDALAYE